MIMLHRSNRLLLALWCVLALQAAAIAADLDRASPESVGLSSSRLDRLDDAMQAEIDAGRKAGIAVLIARRGHVVHEEAFGYADLEHKTPLRTDAYFRMYSMTKPIVSVALLTLLEQGAFHLNDPLAKFIPAMGEVEVYAGEDANGELVLVPQSRPITIQDVLRHTAGFSYGALPGRPAGNPVDQAYADAGVSYGELESLRQLAEEKLPGLPLLYQPGERWVYSFAHDVQGYLVERLSGMPLDQFLEQRIFEPLGMHDSFYGEPPKPGPRRTTVYGPDGDGGLAAVERPLDFPHSRFDDHPFGGAGLTMTMMDYARFAQMLLNDGELDGTRILGRKTVELMTTNNLPPGVEAFPGWGYGLGVGVRLSPAAAGSLGSVGAYGWGGAASTGVIIDPAEQLVVVFCAQQVPYEFEFATTVNDLVYQAIVD